MTDRQAGWPDVALLRDSLCSPGCIQETPFVLPRDTILAYNTYKNQWTSSGKKKLVVDASKVGQTYSLALLGE